MLSDGTFPFVIYKFVQLFAYVISDYFASSHQHGGQNMKIAKGASATKHANV